MTLLVINFRQRPEAVFFLLGPSFSLSVDSRLRLETGSVVLCNSPTDVLSLAFSDDAKIQHNQFQ